ncbi:PH domain-containing protein [Allomuricauda sp. M10]|uniref:PH domain-containing protein n=1 Tax=Allomuricauda sp. M10 TaxID=2683292 RepID=UPI001D18DC3B|nr:PH domain-containing protein [Muricauda sp. M10]
MKFNSRKDILFSSIIAVVILLIMAPLVIDIFSNKMNSINYFSLAIVLGVTFFLLWMYFGTRYELAPDGLVYQCGPMRGKISYDRIREIEKGKTLWVGLKPATARKGLIVKFDRFDEIYISPDTNESFIEKILEKNPDIKISE